MLNRWITCKESYNERIQLMSRYITSESSVLDIGCGQETLKKYLPKNCKYTGCDLIQRSSDTLVINVNTWFILPDIYKYIFCSGVLEYINNLPRFLTTIRFWGNEFIFSYACKQSSIEERQKSDWVNHYTYNELITIFKQYGFLIIDINQWKNQDIFYLIKT